jgi:hypothetical protein
LGRWWVGKANHNLILLRVFLYPQVPVLTHRLAALRPSGVRIYDGRFVASAVLPMFFKTLCDDVDFAGGWLHERGPAGVEVSRDRRRRQKLETN